MPHEIDILVGGPEMAEGRIESAHRASFNAPGQRQDLAGPAVAMPEFESEQIVAVLGQITEEVKLLIEMPDRREMARRRMVVIDNVYWENSRDGMAGEPGADELPVSGPPVGRVASGMHADESEVTLTDPLLDDRALLTGPAGFADGEKHQQPCSLKVRDAQIPYLRNVTETQLMQLGDLRGGDDCRRQAVVSAGQAGHAGDVSVRRDIGDEYELAHEGITAMTLISTRMFFSVAPVVARAG